jgi:Fic-DOC domain mobile mystery protein B
MIEFNYPEDATVLDLNEVEGLLLTHITTRAELNRWEQDNINEALAWISQRKPKDVLNESFIRQLHKRMFSNVWKWAGNFRQTDKNIGTSWYSIPAALKQLCDDTEYWIKNKTLLIHLFANGNGRHARLMADILLENVLKKPPFTWGSANLIIAGLDRKKYIESLIAADGGDYKPLLDFVRA